MEEHEGRGVHEAGKQQGLDPEMTKEDERAVVARGDAVKKAVLLVAEFSEQGVKVRESLVPFRDEIHRIAVRDYGLGAIFEGIGVFPVSGDILGQEIPSPLLRGMRGDRVEFAKPGEDLDGQLVTAEGKTDLHRALGPS